jgi:antitoxin (DNA-binding transcriptional repressor) of toxin-antitoxin stability system
MAKTINTKQLRAELPEIVRRVRKGERFTVLYRSRPAFRLEPVLETTERQPALETDPIYRAGALGHSKDGKTSTDHDALLYGSD